MTIAATAWAFGTPLAEDPIERLVLILCADDTDQHGLCVTILSRIAQVACLTPDGVRTVVQKLRHRGVIGIVQPGDPADPDFDGFDLLFFSGWQDREPLRDGLHPVYGALVIE